jgi:heme exporter protein B
MKSASLIGCLIRRDLSLAASRPAQWLLPTLFFILVAILFPFALGPDAGLLAKVAPGIAWVAVLLASLLPVSTLYATDQADGTLDQLAVRGIAGETLAAARMLSVWLAFGAPLLLALPAVALLLGYPLADVPLLALGLLIGSLGLSALANMAAAFTLGARGGGGLVALVIVPLAVPMLVFGSNPEVPGAIRLLAASALLLAAAAPFATAQALKALRT